MSSRRSYSLNSLLAFLSSSSDKSLSDSRIKNVVHTRLRSPDQARKALQDIRYFLNNFFIVTLAYDAKEPSILSEHNTGKEAKLVSRRSRKTANILSKRIVMSDSLDNMSRLSFDESDGDFIGR
ncbi:unnamed protein product [Protopolystoma xenopodis]|uniref:Uncharacterized protein n=1 Tax=Protopolystoma xenopodis TaxID=117903 RepID=A0A3S5CK76_9PLAT|nr:unnamed protein product [Protopolystoma xenopodis]